MKERGGVLCLFIRTAIFRQKYVKLEREVRARTRDKEITRTLSGCNNLRHGKKAAKYTRTVWREEVREGTQSDTTVQSVDTGGGTPELF